MFMEKFSIIFLVAISISSCGIYRQNVINTPALENKGQLKLGAHLSYTGVEGQASYAVTDNKALMVNYNYKGETKTEYQANNFEKNRHNFGEIGFGFYKKKTTENENANRIIKELFFIIGQGNTLHFVQSIDSAGAINTSFKEASYYRFAVQGNIGIKSKKVLLIFSPRVFQINYFDIKESNVYSLKPPAIYFRLEGAVTIQYQLAKYLSISGQGCMTLPIIEVFSNNVFDDFSPLNISIGLITNLNILKINNK